MRRQNSKRRSAAEWEQLVATWRASGESADDFAEARGLVASTLKVWGWRIGARKKRAEPELRMVPVEIAEEPTVTASGWELTSASGYVLRVQAQLDTEQLDRLLAVMAG